MLYYLTQPENHFLSAYKEVTIPFAHSYQVVLSEKAFKNSFSILHISTDFYFYEYLTALYIHSIDEVCIFCQMLRVKATLKASRNFSPLGKKPVNQRMFPCC